MSSAARPVIEVVACVLRRGNTVCLFKRSQLVGTSRGKWHAVSGYLPANTDPLEHALQELREETGLEGATLRLVRRGEPLVFDRPERRWVVHPFLFEVADGEVQLDWEHDEFVWLPLAEAEAYDTVGWLADVLRAVW